VASFSLSLAQKKGIQASHVQVGKVWSRSSVSHMLQRGDPHLCVPLLPAGRVADALLLFSYDGARPIFLLSLSSITGFSCPGVLAGSPGFLVISDSGESFCAGRQNPDVRRREPE
jgi:hypothetical protein